MKLFQIVSEKMRYPNFDNAISEQIFSAKNEFVALCKSQLEESY